MISENITKVLSKQINEELFSAYLYLAMSSDADRKGLKGFSNWMRAQAQEERFHATKLYEYMLERGAKPTFFDIKAPSKSEWATLTEMFDDALKHEQHITALINNIAYESHNEKDYATNSFIQWYVNEQVEEESSVEEILGTLKFVKEDPSAVFNMDREFIKRAFEEPSE